MADLTINVLCDPDRIPDDVRRANAQYFDFIHTDDEHPHAINYDESMDKFIGYYDKWRVSMDEDVTNVLEAMLEKHIRNGVATSARESLVNDINDLD